MNDIESIKKCEASTMLSYKLSHLKNQKALKRKVRYIRAVESTQEYGDSATEFIDIPLVYKLLKLVDGNSKTVQIEYNAREGSTAASICHQRTFIWQMKK